MNMSWCLLDCRNAATKNRNLSKVQNSSPEVKCCFNIAHPLYSYLVLNVNRPSGCYLNCIDMKSWWLQKIFYDEYCWEHSLPETLNIDVLWNKRSMKKVFVHFYCVCTSLKTNWAFVCIFKCAFTVLLQKCSKCASVEMKYTWIETNAGVKMCAKYLHILFC